MITSHHRGPNQAANRPGNIGGSDTKQWPGFVTTTGSASTQTEGSRWAVHNAPPANSQGSNYSQAEPIRIDLLASGGLGESRADYAVSVACFLIPHDQCSRHSPRLNLWRDHSECAHAHTHTHTHTRTHAHAILLVMSTQ